MALLLLYMGGWPEEIASDNALKHIHLILESDETDSKAKNNLKDGGILLNEVGRNLLLKLM